MGVRPTRCPWAGAPAPTHPCPCRPRRQHGHPRTLTRTTGGTVLKPQTASGTSAPLAVTDTGKVTNLDAAPFAGKPVPRYTLPLPSGSDAVSYTTYVLEAPAGGVECYLIQDNATVEDLCTGWSSTSQVRLQCNAAGPWSTGGTDTPIRIVTTPAHLVSTATINPDTLS